MNQLPTRFKSIDVFRAITMLLMVFVNDLDPVKNVPEWLKHVGKNVDGLGFADTIFPAFLFIVGLSLPFAIDNRLKKGQSRGRVAVYILTRSLALLLMGFFHVNLENYNPAALLPKAVWEILITVAFFLVWLDYPRDMPLRKRYVLQGAGIVLLVLMALLFKGGNETHPVGLRTSWWGILGLIGWSYLICSIIYLLSKGLLVVQLAAAVFFFVFNLRVHAGWMDELLDAKPSIWIVGNGAVPAFTMAGVVISCLYTRFAVKDRIRVFQAVLPAAGIGMMALGFLLRSYDGISKLRGTPSWVGICTGISMLVFGLLVWLIDRRQKENWFKVIMPAGTSTLTCYLIPYLLYSMYKLVGFQYPTLLNEGVGGLIRSMLVALLAVLLTGWLEKKRLRLKI
ncbi:MAG TPA: DUF5009 domain-containing protein [Chitinophagaceae bacterium]|nr:DUF5009 domain-containing protein [Chitinophagaceae bacterium]